MGIGMLALFGQEDDFSLHSGSPSCLQSYESVMSDFQIKRTGITSQVHNFMYIYTLTTNRIMITDAQVFTALVIALISGLLAIRLGTRLYI